MKYIQGVVAQPSKPERSRSNTQACARRINSVVNNLINSQYVIKDRVQFNSLLQTPLRESLTQLRQIADQLEGQPNATKSVGRFNEDWSRDVHSEPKAIVKELFRFITLCEFNCDLTLKCEYEEPVFVNLPSKWLKHAFAEVLINALKHNHHYTKLSIRVTLSVSQGQLHVVVQDNGKGIPYEITNEIERAALTHGHQVFTKYRQLSPDSLLAIQTQLMNRNGTFEVKSARKFKTTIRLTLPLAKGEIGEKVFADNVNENIAAYSKKIAQHSESLLLVRHQDSAFNPKYDYALDILSEAFNITQACSLQEGLENLSGQVPSCIVMEAKASEGSMSMLKAWLNLSPKFTSVPMVVITETLGQYRQLDAMHSGINAFISKPVDYREVIDIVRSLLQEKARFVSLIEKGIAKHHIEKADEKDGDETSNVFKRKFTTVLEQHYHEEEFNKSKAASLMLMHEKTLSRRMNAYYDASFTEVIRRFRLCKAKEMIMDGSTVTSTAYSCGFNSPSYFTQCFKNEFGFAPSMLCR